MLMVVTAVAVQDFRALTAGYRQCLQNHVDLMTSETVWFLATKLAHTYSQTHHAVAI